MRLFINPGIGRVLRRSPPRSRRRPALAHLAQQRRPCRSSMHKPACDHFRHAFDARRVCALIATTGTTRPSLGQVPAVAQHLVVDLADPRAVDQHAADRRLARRRARPRASNRMHVAVLRQQSPSTGVGSPRVTNVATRACRASCRYSPCIGTKYRGRTSESTASALPRCRGRTRGRACCDSVMMSTPRRAR